MNKLPSTIADVLATVADIYSDRSIDRWVTDWQMQGDAVSLTVTLPYPAMTIKEQFAKRIDAALATVNTRLAELTLRHRIVPYAVQGEIKPLPNIKNIIAVASGKGGVGKSTTSVNVALALAREGASVGILDADIYGPNIPHMLGIAASPQVVDGGLLPLRAHGIQCMSMASLVPADTAMIWRGPMATQALRQMLDDTRWQDLDYLIVDLPPGTGDVQLSLAQRAPISGAVVVTTPQSVALLDAVRGIMMFAKVKIPVLGVIENMSYYECAHCGEKTALFGEGGGARVAAEHNLPLLGHVPLLPAIRTGGDIGLPAAISSEQPHAVACYSDIARRMAAALSERPRDDSHKFPDISVG